MSEDWPSWWKQYEQMHGGTLLNRAHLGIYYEPVPHLEEVFDENILGYWLAINAYALPDSDQVRGSVQAFPAGQNAAHERLPATHQLSIPAAQHGEQSR